MSVVLKAEDITKKYGEKIVLNKVNMTINKGDIYGFIGKNGAGKTTFMRVILSLTEKDSGDFNFFEGKNLKDVGLKIGSLIENPGLYENATVYENLKRFSILYGVDEETITNVLKIVNLEYASLKKVSMLSLGMRQRLGIAIALLNEPEFMVLDEPVNGLDPEGIRCIRDLIIKLNKEKNVTFLISSHLLDELSKIATKYGIINNGVLIEEISSEELKNKCLNKTIVEVNNPIQAKELLLKIIPSESISVIGNKIEIDIKVDPMVINRYLVTSNIEVKGIYESSENIEDYFLKLIGDKNE